MSFSLIGKLGIDASGVAAGIAKAQNAFRSGTATIANSVKGQFAAFLGVSAITAAARATTEYAGQLADLSARLNVSTDVLQEWGYAAKQTGASQEAVAGFFEKIAVSRNEALAGNKEYTESFRRLGVTIKDLQGMSIEQIGTQIAKVFESGNPQQYIDALRELGGSGAGELIPAFASGMADMAAQAHATGQVIQESVIKRLDDFGDKLDRLIGSLRGPMATTLVWMIDRLNDVGKAFRLLGAWSVQWQQGGGVGGGWGNKKGGKGFIDWLGSPEAAQVLADADAEAQPTAKPTLPPAVFNPADFRVKTTPTKKSASQSAVRPDSFDSLNKIGGFAQRGDFSIVAPLERIARASEDTAENTHSLRGAYS
jgi:hypothetical protein